MLAQASIHRGAWAFMVVPDGKMDAGLRQQDRSL